MSAREPLRLCRTCGGRYIPGYRNDHVWTWHWWCKPDTCSRHHRHAFAADGAERRDTDA